MKMPAKGKRAAVKGKRRDGSVAQAAADKALAKERIDYSDLNARVLGNLVLPGGPSEKY
jgi:hypothetical protein